MTHNTAILIYLLQNNHKWVSIGQIRSHTALLCKSECYKVGTRVSDLRVKYGYPIENKKQNVDGVVHSSYKIALYNHKIQELRSQWPFRNPPQYQQTLKKAI
jgi:hypothetical protein